MQSCGALRPPSLKACRGSLVCCLVVCSIPAIGLFCNSVGHFRFVCALGFGVVRGNRAGLTRGRHWSLTCRWEGLLCHRFRRMLAIYLKNYESKDLFYWHVFPFLVRF